MTIGQDGAAPRRLATSAVPAEGRRGRGATANPSGRFEAAARVGFDDGWGEPETARARTQVTRERTARILTRMYGWLLRVKDVGSV